MPDKESIQNIAMALYEASPIIRDYVNAIAAGNTVPYTILTKSTEADKNEQIVARARERKAELEGIEPMMRDSEVDSMLDAINEILDEDFVLEEDGEYEVVMLRADYSVVDGSRQIVSDLSKIPMMKEYAKHKGFEFSIKKLGLKS